MAYADPQVKILFTLPRKVRDMVYTDLWKEIVALRFDHVIKYPGPSRCVCFETSVSATFRGKKITTSHYGSPPIIGSEKKHCSGTSDIPSSTCPTYFSGSTPIHTVSIKSLGRSRLTLVDNQVIGYKHTIHMFPGYPLWLMRNLSGYISR
ncbi:hypothetical protein P171DRAFT_80373 [Karstenula rhodostoma CBS 690.94]|uniref:Uncharacterized protein n=1 Tax=Karstenula rhodostoma CBS 690.94 TaxID=1392251 RepID=A0A9P4PD67_9PLEO|nr:hypothetical protein P171DRAFT_80373 [Karstenula rhodostoma CBS 690.94]